MSTSGLTSLVVVAYHRAESLARVLEATIDPAIEVVVVNVEADTEVRDVVASHIGAAIVDIDNLGYAAAVNAGAAKATGDVIVYTNDDVAVDAATVCSLADVVRSGTADVAVPAVLDANRRVTPTIYALATPRNLLVEWALLPDRSWRPLGRRLRVEKWRRPVRAERIVAASAVTVAVSATLLRAIPMPEQYFLYWEESDWFARLARCNARVVYEPALAVQHAGGRSDIRADKMRLMARNAVRCVRDTQGLAAGRRAWWAVMTWQVRLWVVDTIRASLGRPDFGDRVAARRAGVIAAWRARELLR